MITRLQFTKLAAALALAITALFAMGARSWATGTPEDIAVTYSGTTPNGTITAGTGTVQTSAAYSFGDPQSFTMTATNISTSATYSLSASTSTGSDQLAFSPAALPAGVYTLVFDNGGNNFPDGTDILFTLTPNLTVVSTISTPTLTTVSPSDIAAGSPALSITATGTGFISGATVDWNGAPLTTAFGSATSLTATVPAPDLASAGTADVTVVNPDTGTTGAVTFTVDPAPTLTGISPSSALAGSAAVTVTATGTGFITGATVDWNGAPLITNFVSATSLTATIPVGDLHSAGAVNVNVVNPDTGTTGDKIFTIGSVPALTGISPTSALAGSPATKITADGTGFVSGATIHWNGTALATTFVSATSLTATIPAADLRAAAAAAVTVVNPDTAVSGAKTFAIGSVPTLTAVSPPNSVALFVSTAITATGTGFVTGAAIRWNGTPLATTFVSATTLTATITTDDLTYAGTFPITVANPDGAVSNAFSFVVLPDFPGIESITPSKADAGDDPMEVVIAGFDFTNTSEVSFGPGATTVPDSFVSATELDATLSADDLYRAGSYPVTVATTGGTSEINFTVDPVAAFDTGLMMISAPYDTTGVPVTPTTIGWIDSVTGAETNDTSLAIVDWTGTAYAAPTDGLKLGAGYWMRVPSLNDSGGKPEALSLLIKGTPVSAGTSFKVKLAAGWNLIGDPLAQSVPLTDLSVETISGSGTATVSYLKAAQAGVVGTEFYTYDSAVSSDYLDESITQADTGLKPYAGYWVLALTPCTLVFPAP